MLFDAKHFYLKKKDKYKVQFTYLQYKITNIYQMFLIIILLTCCANSLVGARIRPIGPSPGASSFWSIICTRRGQRNAAVLPEPVRAIP